MLDEEGEGIEGLQGKDDFMVARRGDNLMTPFQCDECHFVNMQGRNSRETEQDQMLLRLIRRANLDAFWDRSSSTVEAHHRDVKKMDQIAEDLGMEPVQTHLGLWDVKDDFGMKIAVIMLKWSLDPGRTEARVQFDTVRKLRASATNLFQAGPEGLKDRVAAFERSRLWLTTMPSQSYWFHRFVSGYHKRVGETKRQDEALLVETLKGMQAMWEQEWRSNTEVMNRKKIATLATWFLVGFCCGLRGEEMLLIETAGTEKSIEEELTTPVPHFEVMISGKTKGNQVSGRKFAVPCVNVTEGSGLEPGVWLRRLIRLQAETHNKWGQLFQNRMGTLRLRDYKQMFLGALREAQLAEVEGIKSTADVFEEYGILRSLRRGVTAHAQNVGVKREVLNAVNRWRKHAQSQTGAPRLDMVETYSQLNAVKPFVLEFSRKL